VTVERNQYSVPCHLANSRATIHLYSNRVDVYTENANIACHKRLLGRDEVSYDWQHYIPLLEKKPGALRNGAHPLRRCRFPLLNYKPLYDAENGNKVIGLWLKCWPQYLLMV
jgi:hypothetical protein